MAYFYPQELDDDIICFLMRENYFLGRKVGEGKTRIAYEVTYNKRKLREFRQRRILKIPKSEVGSIQSKVNFSRGDANQNEIQALSTLNHPSIIRLLDVLCYQSETHRKDKIFTVEEYFDSLSLEQLIEMEGPIINPKQFRAVFLPVIEGLRYLHAEKNLLHRDLKPSNILVGKQTDQVKIIDFQNVGNSFNAGEMLMSPEYLSPANMASLNHFFSNTGGFGRITERVLPTRGGINFTDPVLLNDFLSGKESKVTFANELYSLGATMYYALTGETPFDYALVSDREGKVFFIDRERIKISLTEDGKPVQSIDIKELGSRLLQRLDAIPHQYRKLLFTCLSPEEEYSDNGREKAYTDLGEDFEKATRKRPISKKKKKRFSDLKEYFVSKANCGKTDETELFSMIGEAEMYVLTHGVRGRFKPFTEDSGLGGSDAYTKSRNGKEYSVKEGDFEVQIMDLNEGIRYGVESPGWSERYVRVFNVLVDGKVIFNAGRHLGGEKGSWSRGTERIEPISWEDCFKLG